MIKIPGVITLLALLSSTLLSCELHGQPAQAHAKAEPTADSDSAVLVELFTSEGCSSCPPADALLRQINDTRAASGQLVVGISEHVTYWNSLGWSDPFSAEAFTDRQNSYSNRFNLDSVYTPQMVINGTEQIVGSDRNSLLQALRRESGRPRMALHILSSTTDSGSSAGPSLTVTFSHGKAPGTGDVDVFAVLTDDLDHSNVLRGENSGRTITHVSVARLLIRVGTVRENGQAEGQTAFQIPLPSSVLLGHGGHHLVLFAQASHFGAVLGTDTRPISIASSTNPTVRTHCCLILGHSKLLGMVHFLQRTA